MVDRSIPPPYSISRATRDERASSIGNDNEAREEALARASPPRVPLPLDGIPIGLNLTPAYQDIVDHASRNVA